MMEDYDALNHDVELLLEHAAERNEAEIDLHVTNEVTMEFGELGKEDKEIP